MSRQASLCKGTARVQIILFVSSSKSGIAKLVLCKGDLFIRFNARAFYREVRRVLKPQGSLAAWAYMPPQIKDREVATAVVYDFFFKTLYPYMETPHKEYMAQYRGIEPTATEFEIVTRDSLDFGQSSSIRRVVLLST